MSERLKINDWVFLMGDDGVTVQEIDDCDDVVQEMEMPWSVAFLLMEFASQLWKAGVEFRDEVALDIYGYALRYQEAELVIEDIESSVTLPMGELGRWCPLVLSAYRRYLESYGGRIADACAQREKEDVEDAEIITGLLRSMDVNWDAIQRAAVSRMDGDRESDE